MLLRNQLKGVAADRGVKLSYVDPLFPRPFPFSPKPLFPTPLKPLFLPSIPRPVSLCALSVSLSSQHCSFSSLPVASFSSPFPRLAPSLRRTPTCVSLHMLREIARSLITWCHDMLATLVRAGADTCRLS